MDMSGNKTLSWEPFQQAEHWHKWDRTTSMVVLSPVHCVWIALQFINFGEFAKIGIEEFEFENSEHARLHCGDRRNTSHSSSSQASIQHQQSTINVPLYHYPSNFKQQCMHKVVSCTSFGCKIPCKCVRPLRASKGRCLPNHTCIHVINVYYYKNAGSLPKDDPNVGTGIVGAPACGYVPLNLPDTSLYPASSIVFPYTLYTSSCTSYFSPHIILVASLSRPCAHHAHPCLCTPSHFFLCFSC